MTVLSASTKQGGQALLKGVTKGLLFIELGGRPKLSHCRNT